MTATAAVTSRLIGSAGRTMRSTVTAAEPCSGRQSRYRLSDEAAGDSDLRVVGTTGSVTGDRVGGSHDVVGSRKYRIERRTNAWSISYNSRDEAGRNVAKDAEPS